MATRHSLDHDLDPNQHRMLGARGADLTITAGGDLTMGACNYANVTPAGGILRRVQTVDWTQGSVISFRTTADLTIQHGAGAGSGFVGIATPDGLPFTAKAGDVVNLTLDGSVWCLPRASGDTYLIKARNADATTVGGLMEKTIDSPTIERTLTVDGDGVEVVAFNTLAQADPISFESTLYAAHLDDALLLPQVACGFFLATGGGHEIIAFKYDWDNLRPGVWRCKFPGITLPQGYCRGVTPVAGMRVFVGYLGEDGYPEAEMNANDKPRTGIYQFTDPGRRWLEPNGPYEDTYAVLERVDELDAAVEFQTGVLAYIAGGTDWAGKYARLTTTGTIVLETTPLEWELLSSYAPTAADNLLTAAQLARASDTPNTTALVASDGSPSAWLEFPTLAGTPNLDTYRAGRTEAHVLARLHIAGAAGSITWLECQVVRDPGGDDEVLETINTSPITNQTDEVIKAHIDDDEDQDLAGDRIGLRIRARSDSATPAAIAVTWSDPAHSTRLLTPMTLAVGGTDDHQALTMTSRGFVAGEEADARAFGHPQRYIAPGRVQTPANETVTSADGLFAVPLNSNFVVLEGTENLIGCSTEGWTGPGWIEVHILNERDILKSQSPLPDGYAPFMWGSTDTGYGADYDVQTAYAGSIFRFRWTGGVWRIAGVMNM